MNSLEEIQTKIGLTNEQLRLSIEPENYSQLAQLFDNCDQYLDQREFNLSDSDKEAIKKLAHNQEKVELLLHTWRMKTDPNEFTFKVLIEILLHRRQRNIAIKVAEYVRTMGKCQLVYLLCFEWIL